MMKIESKGKEIRSIEEWFAHAPPKASTKQWVDNRSAKECAKAWLETVGAPPPEISKLLRSHADLIDVEIKSVMPEAELRFDKRPGPRNADLAIVARDAHGPIAITVEAKADEPFDLLISEVASRSLEERIKKPRSRAWERIADLAQSLLAPRAADLVHASDLRYQLLTATAGTLALARDQGATRAIVIVHEIVTSATSRARLSRNAVDLQNFIQRVAGTRIPPVVAGTLYGPFTVPGKPLFEPPAALYFGKAVRCVGEPTA